MAPQPHLFDSDNLPPGFEYRPGFVTAEEETELVRDIAALTFSRVEMRGVVARRRTAHFGWTYEYEGRGSEPGEPIPSFLLPLRDRAAAWAEVAPDDFAEALVTEYPAGAPIGWHRDAPQFGDVIAGISLLQAVRMKFRPYISPAALGGVGPRAIRRTTHEITLEPRSGYLITGVARREYEHSIPETEALRYSVTFRTLRKKR